MAHHSYVHPLKTGTQQLPSLHFVQLPRNAALTKPSVLVTKAGQQTTYVPVRLEVYTRLIKMPLSQQLKKTTIVLDN